MNITAIIKKLGKFDKVELDREMHHIDRIEFVGYKKDKTFEIHYDYDLLTIWYKETGTKMFRQLIDFRDSI